MNLHGIPAQIFSDIGSGFLTCPVLALRAIHGSPQLLGSLIKTLVVMRAEWIPFPLFVHRAFFQTHAPTSNCLKKVPGEIFMTGLITSQVLDHEESPGLLLIQT